MGETLRIAITGCGRAARVHLERLLAVEGVRLVGCADPDVAAAENLATWARAQQGEGDEIVVATDHRDLLKRARPAALAIFTPHLAHYRPALDALQAGCHVFVEKPLSGNSQEAADIVGLAQARGRKVGVGHQFRLRPSLIETRRRLAEGVIGTLRMVTAVLAQPWLEHQRGAENSWRFDAKIAGGGILADAGDHLVDALLWTTGRGAVEVGALQSRLESGLDVVTAAAIRLDEGVPATLAIAGVTPGSLFAIDYFGEIGRLRATDQILRERIHDGETKTIELPEQSTSIDANFVAAVRGDAPLCCPASEAVATVRLLEAIARSASSLQIVKLS